VRRALAIVAATGGVLALLAGSPYPLDVQRLATAVAREDDHVTAVELAAWLRAGKHRLRVVDVRTPPEFAIYHIPGAENVPIESLTAVPFPAEDTVVLYSEVGIHGAQAWVFLRALGHRRVYFLRNGLHEWLDDVMSPTIAEGAPADAQAAFDRVAELSRFFGGMPRKLTGRADTSEDALRARRRGC